MSEIHISLFAKHESEKIHQQLKKTFELFNDESEFFKDNNLLKDICLEINPAIANEAFDEFTKKAGPIVQNDFFQESLYEDSGVWVTQLVCGNSASDQIQELIKLFNLLNPEIIIQVWGCGDEDPWEFWIKKEDGIVIYKDNEPGSEAQEIYDWWHSTLPEEISVGIMNDSDYVEEIDFEDQFIVFTGKMEEGTREEMEELAEEFGAVVQKSINGKTTLLVIGEKAGKSKLDKAKELGVKTITEEQFYYLTE